MENVKKYQTAVRELAMRKKAKEKKSFLINLIIYIVVISLWIYSDFSANGIQLHWSLIVAVCWGSGLLAKFVSYWEIGRDFAKEETEAEELAGLK